LLLLLLLLLLATEHLVEEAELRVRSEQPKAESSERERETGHDCKANNSVYFKEPNKFERGETRAATMMLMWSFVGCKQAKQPRPSGDWRQAVGGPQKRSALRIPVELSTAHLFQPPTLHHAAQLSRNPPRTSPLSARPHAASPTHPRTVASALPPRKFSDES
jgi:hypothetical protein